MKLNPFFSAITLLLLVFTACQTKEKNACDAVNCLNGGVCLDGTCNCPTGYSGTNCENHLIEIGKAYQGGIIFYIDATGEHGLIAATNDQGSVIPWGCAGTLISGASNSNIGAGAANTDAIAQVCSESGIAAKVCANLVFGGKSDWYLPSRDELDQLYQHKDVVGGFSNEYYWSSTQQDNVRAFQLHFGNGSVGVEGKANSYPVRAIRSF